MTIIDVENHPSGLRVRVCGQRIHHGAAGIVLAALLAWHDRRDWRVWFKVGPQKDAY